MKGLNIGCGYKIKEGYINLDSKKLKGVDVVHDLNKYPYPFKDNSFDIIEARAVLEHLNDIVKPLEELHRILKPNGKINIRVPIYPSITYFNDPTHKSVYSYYTFFYFEKGSGWDYYSSAKFKIKFIEIEFHKSLFLIQLLINMSRLTQKIYYNFLFYIIPASFLNVILEKEEK